MAEPPRGWPRTAIQTIGEVCITVGVVFLLFAVYELWWTNQVAVQATEAARLEAQAVVHSKNPPSWDGGQPPLHTPFALLYIPRLRDHVWGLPIIQGVTRDDLARGVGHYPRTALPGQVGNFAIAGHRATHGEPFANFDQLRDQDKVYISTQAGWYVYELRRDMIFSPTETWAIDPQPFPANPLPSQQLITLTTCNPRWASTSRWAFWGVLVASQPRASGPPPGIAG